VNRADGSETPVPQVTADEIVDVDARNSELLADLGGLFADASTVIGEVVADALDVSLSDAVKDVWREIGANRLDRLVNGSTSYPGWTRQIVDDVTEAIQAAYQAGESVDGAIARVEALVGPDRAERVARTELSGLMNEVSYRQMKDAGVERKRWYSVGDNRTRSSHQMLNGTTIRFDEKFTVGGVAADGPHDTVLPASEVVNCRCRLIPVLD
jgi:SPP1 gp7 family putative phage head morphogenesis protein